MFVLSSPVTLQLARGELIAWPRQSAVTVKVIAGCVWITRRHDPEDHMLMPGQSLHLARGAVAVLEGECDATLRVEAAPGWTRPLLAGAARRMRRLLRAGRLPGAAVPG
jgi:hypothetical protein